MLVLDVSNWEETICEGDLEEKWATLEWGVALPTGQLYCGCVN